MAKREEKIKAARKAAKQQRKTNLAKRTLTKAKKKQWIPLYAPPFFAEQVLGDCFAPDQESVVGRKLTVSVANLTREMRKQAYKITFEALQPKGKGVATAMTGYELALSQTKRLVRKRRTKVADSFLVKSKDEKVARIKPFLVTRGRIPHSLQTKMRLEARKILAREAQRSTFLKLMEDIIQGKTQKLLKVNLQKFYPLHSTEIRKFTLERADTPLEFGETVMEMPRRRKSRKVESDAKSDKASEKPSETPAKASQESQEKAEA